MTAKFYRPDIDGLRAIAVLSVVFFHTGIPGFDGGFVGVDVFFVISGFLITRNILSRMHDGNFTFRDFYVRRARRLFPALCFTLALAFVFSLWLLPPDNMASFGGSLASALFSVSNFFFWSEAGYFDTDAHLKPLLHTWSLSVEEQFYAIWPLLLLFLVRFGRSWGAPAILFLMFITSVGASEWYARTDPTAAFYITPFRIFELALGALCVWSVDRWRTGRWQRESVFVTGLVLVVAPVFLYDSQTYFPGLNALVPCIGSAIIICLGNTSASARVLNNRPMVGVGLVSYSFYLIHWPVIVFYIYYRLEPLSLLERAALIFISLIVAAFMYRYVEQPFRRKTGMVARAKPWMIGAAYLSVAGLFGAAGLHAAANKGWPERYAADLHPLILDVRAMRTNTLVVARDREVFPKEGATNALIIGDSHATDLFNALEQNDPAVYLKRRGISRECQPAVGPRPGMRETESDECRRRFRKILESDDIKGTALVLFSARWEPWAVERLPETITAMRKKTDARIIVFGPTVEFTPEVPILIARHGKVEDARAFVNRFQTEGKREISQRAAELAGQLGVDYVDKIEVLCGAEQQCPVRTPEGEPVFTDYGHWSDQGSRLFGGLLKSRRTDIAELLEVGEGGS